jgi:type III restriction enzyme
LTHGRRNYSDACLVVCPGITIKDRLRVLYPSHPDNYYESRGLVPDDMLGAIRSARVVITNYHAFKLRETLQLPKHARAVLQGRDEELRTKENEGQMLARVWKPSQIWHDYIERHPSEALKARTESGLNRPELKNVV